MRATLTTLVVALAVVVALIGAVGFVSADVTSQGDTAPHANGPAGTMADHAPGQFGEMMHGVGEHVPGMHGTDHGHGHADHNHAEHHADHDHAEHHADHNHGEHHAGNSAHC